MSQLYPFTDPAVALENPPKTIVAGRGCFVTDSSGKTYFSHKLEQKWIENTEKQFKDRPVPGFQALVEGPVGVDHLKRNVYDTIHGN